VLKHLLAALVFSAALATLLPACAAPTLPLPPPTALVSSPDPEGIVTVTGIARADAYVFALNNRTDSGVIGRADPSGRYSLRLAAQRGDVLSIWYISGASNSGVNDVEVP
jgi:hypothetical protein